MIYQASPLCLELLWLVEVCSFLAGKTLMLGAPLFLVFAMPIHEPEFGLFAVT